ncbi:hypothetical protein [Micromonospora zamorensis]|uniref:hypothetical protein n=1 Tax=Micromonospora zamorensis TaxID=709883 RepID=UPI0037A7943B
MRAQRHGPAASIEVVGPCAQHPTQGLRRRPEPVGDPLVLVCALHRRPDDETGEVLAVAGVRTAALTSSPVGEPVYRRLVSSRWASSAS